MPASIVPEPKDSATAVDDLVAAIEDAARLRLFTLPYEVERRDSPQARVFYAVDTNIVQLFLAPSLVGPRNEAGNGYGAVFHFDNAESSTALGAALSRFIFYYLRPKTPLVLLPGHDAELRRAYDAILRSAELEERNSLSSLKANRSKLLSLLNESSSSEVADRIRYELPELIEFIFYSSSSNARLRRFNDLIQGGRTLRLTAFATAEQFYATDGADNSTVRRAFHAVSTTSDRWLEVALEQEWARRLSAENRARAPARLRPDARALARLELVNRKMQLVKGERVALVLITGDEAMFRAAERYRPFGDDQADFATLFLRHPQAFLASPEVLLPGVTSGSIHTPALVSDWLDTLLAEYTRDRGIDKRSLLALLRPGPGKDQLRLQVRRVVEGDRSSVEKIRVEWAGHTSFLREAHTVESRLAHEEMRRVLGRSFFESAETKLRAIEQHLAQRSEETWRGVFDALMRAGFELIESESVRKRNPPPITFDSFKATAEFVRTVVSKDGLLKVGPQLQIWLDRIEMDDSTGYVRALAFALLFAHAQRWHVAAILAERAVRLAERVGPEAGTADPTTTEISRISGREAHYLLAVASRLQARRLSDLERVSEHLLKAEAALSSDRQRDANLSVTSLRFDAEWVALDLTKFFFGWFSALDSAQGDAIDHDSLLIIFNKLKELRSRVSAEDDVWVRINVERNILTNIFVVAAFLDKQERLDKEEEKLCWEFCKIFESNISYAPNHGDFDIPISKLVEIARDYARARFMNNEPKESREIIDRIEKINVKEIATMPYDAERFDFLLGETKRALATGARRPLIQRLT